MTKADLLKKVAEKAGCSQTVANSVINATIETIVSEVRDNGEDLTLQGLGTFKQKATEVHEGFNPLTKQKIQIEASKTIQFKVAPSVKVKG